jgi:hypothetical protein
MRNAALVLGIIGGLVGMIVGFFSYGYTEFIDWAGQEIPDTFQQVDNVGLIKIMSLFSPLLAIAGGAMARSRAMLGGGLLLLSSAGMFLPLVLAPLRCFLLRCAHWAGCWRWQPLSRIRIK